MEQKGMEIYWLSPQVASIMREIDPDSETGKRFLSMSQTWMGVEMCCGFTFSEKGYFPARGLKVKNTYWGELGGNLRKRKKYTAPDLPSIVHQMRNPSAKFPLTREVPKGTYMFTFVLSFPNLVAHIRIRKNENV